MADLVASSGDSTRASDADRDRVLKVLATATADGRLTVDEHSDLMTRTLHARTVGELVVITQDLSPHAWHEPPPSPVVAGGSESRRGFLAIFGARTRKGSWHVPTEFKATAVFGAVELDFRDATFEAADVTCVASCVFGAIEITVPEWVRVIDDGTAIFGAREEVGRGAVEPTVTLHLKGLSVFGATEVKRKAPKPSKGDGRSLADPTTATGAAPQIGLGAQQPGIPEDTIGT